MQYGRPAGTCFLGGRWLAVGSHRYFIIFHFRYIHHIIDWTSLRSYHFVCVFLLRLPLAEETVIDQAPWHRRDVVGLPAGRPLRSGSRRRGAGSPAGGGAARRRPPSAGSPAGGAVAPRRAATTRSRSPYGCFPGIYSCIRIISP